MYYQMLPRMSMEQGETLSSAAVSAQDHSVLICGVTVYTITGTSPTLTVGIETSDDGEIWSSVGTIVTATALGLTLGNFGVTGNEWGRLVRVQVVVSGTNAVAEFGIGLRTLTSS